MASTTRVSAAAERRRAGNLLQASVADGMGFSDHATIVVRRNGRNSSLSLLDRQYVDRTLPRQRPADRGRQCPGSVTIPSAMRNSRNA